jgi:uncharacterized damage-inducible protein DinB
VERLDPPRAAGEKETLTAWMDYHRATLLNKIDGVSDDDLRRPMVPSGTTLLGLVKHLAYVERWWFRRVFLDIDLAFPWTDDDPDADFRIKADETTDDIVRLYQAECEESRAVVRDASLDDMAKYEYRTGFSLRWILTHMIEETARHNGHADILREQIDGSTGE